MNAGELINNLQGLGYQLSVDGVNLRFRYTGAGEPPEGAATLLEGLRQRKAEVVSYLLLGKQADFEAMFNQALEEINGRYESGAIPYIRGNYPALWQEIVGTENQLNDSWLAGKAESFKKALDQWKGLNLRAVKTFRERGNQESLFNFDKGGGEKDDRKKRMRGNSLSIGLKKLQGKSKK